MKNLKQIIDQAKDQAAQSIADEAADQIERVMELPWLISQFPAWKKWYLKKNQPNNYFRVTCIVPPGMEDREFLWLCKFQVWVKEKIEIEYRITSEAYKFFSSQQDWVQSKHNPDHYLYHPQKS